MAGHFKQALIFLFILANNTEICWQYSFKQDWDPDHKKYSHFSESDRLRMVEASREMFQFGYDGYMKYAFPDDELDPIHCRGRGPDYNNPDNININDVLGDYSLSLLESLGTLAVMGNSTEFKRAVKLVIEYVSFNKNSTVQVFEANIRLPPNNRGHNGCITSWYDVPEPERNLVKTYPHFLVVVLVTRSPARDLARIDAFPKSSLLNVGEIPLPRILGSLLSAHLIIIDPRQPLGDMSVPDYNDDLLELAHDLAARLLPAFSDTATGIPYPRVSLMDGVPSNCINETCTSGAGTLVLEFGVLSRLLKDPVYESVARRAVASLWQFRSNVTGLLGNVINIQTGEWVGTMSGLGAGIDSFIEYLLKAYILFGDSNDLKMFNESYETIKFHLRRGRATCNNGTGTIPLYVNVNMKTGEVINTWIDSLQAAWSAVQVLHGDIEEAICSHAVFYAIWRKYNALPERYNWQLKSPDVRFYPLRPELIESTYFLYRATKNPFYLHVGRDILNSISEHAKDRCGYCTIHDVHTKELEDRMESFFLSETCKYLYLLFDTDNPVNQELSRYLFTTEGHILPLDKRFHKNMLAEEAAESAEGQSAELLDNTKPAKTSPEINKPVVKDVRKNVSNCDVLTVDQQFNLPLQSRYLTQLEVAVGLRDDT